MRYYLYITLFIILFYYRSASWWQQLCGVLELTTGYENVYQTSKVYVHVYIIYIFTISYIYIILTIHFSYRQYTKELLMNSSHLMHDIMIYEFGGPSKNSRKCS